MASEERRFTAPDGTRLSWTEAGSRDGAPLLLVHGFPFNRSMWRPQLQETVPGWRVIAPDLRGYGVSEAAGESVLTMDVFADDVAALADHLGIRSAVFGGLSMGGYILFALLRRRPQLVRGLILSDTRAGADSAEARATRLATAERVEEQGTASFIDDMIPKLLAARTRRVLPAVAAELRGIMAAATAASVAATLRGLAERADASAALNTVQVPALVVVGAADEITPPAEARLMTRALRSAELVEIPDAGHVPNLEQPDAFNRAVASFLSALER
ncbi:MAG TPA: alpha/beta fold hydrolase [Longimicrobiales bacterium]|nr:alpha/beta fold hydrolase [Longimicrobiales bacterium]